MLAVYFKDFGYTQAEYNLIRNSYSLLDYKDETLLEKFLIITNFFLDNKYSKQEIIKMTKALPAIYCLSIENIKQKIEDLISLGYTREEVIKMTKILPAIFSYSIENVKQKIEDMIILGYTREEVIKMIKTLPVIYGFGIENMEQKIEDMIILGYTREEVIKMTKILPSIYCLSIENIKQKMKDVIELGYTREEVIEISKILPSIFSFSIENIKQKIEFYDSIDMHDLAIVSPRQLMQSIALSYARYNFYLSIGIVINMDNYRKLFIDHKRFEKTYGITKEELLNRYDYKKEMEYKNGRTL